MVTAYWLALLLIGVERLAELALCRRHARRALARGGIELGRRHYRVMRFVHAAWLGCCALEVVLVARPMPAAVGLPMLGLVAGAQALRWWSIASLGAAWSTRTIVVPGTAVAVRGPYRWVRHPNYVAVAIEVPALPLAGCAFITAALFGAANLALLGVRIRCEEGALAAYTDWSRRFAYHPRFLPRSAP